MSNQVTERPGQKRQPTRRAAPQRTARKSAPQSTVRNRPKQAARRSRKKPTRRRVALGKIFGRTFVRRLVTSVAVAVFIGLVLMAFLRVRNISVVGNSMYSREEIQEASGISEGSALLLVNKTTAASRIRAQLPYIDLAGPTKLLGTNTVDCMRAGAVIGCAAMLDGIIDRMEEELGKPVSAVLTGGVSPLIVPHCRHKFHLEPDILIDGLQILYEKNQGGKG